MKKDPSNAESSLLRPSGLNRLTGFADACSQPLAWVAVVLLICSLVSAQNPISAPPTDSAPQQAPGAIPAPAAPAATPAPAAKDRAIPTPPTPWQILREGVNTHNAQHRAEAVAALGTVGPKRQVVALVEKALTDKDTSIRQLAARTLGEMQARASIPKLRQALKDDSPQVSFAAAKSLWTMGDHSGRNVFIEILSGERSSSNGVLKGELESTKKKFQDPKSLAFIGAKEAASSLFGPAGWGISLLEEVHKDRSASARAMSAILLGPDASLDALRELQDALTDQNWIVRAAAAQALGTCRRRDQIQYLRPLLEDDKPAVRYMASASIIRLSNSEPGTAADKKGSLKSEARPVLGPRGPNSLE